MHAHNRLGQGDDYWRRWRGQLQLRRAVDQPGCVGGDSDGHHAAQGLRHYAEVLRGKRATQAAATEIHQKLVSEKTDELVRDVEQLGKFTAEEMKTLKRLLKSLRQPAQGRQRRP